MAEILAEILAAIEIIVAEIIIAEIENWKKLIDNHLLRNSSSHIKTSKSEFLPFVNNKSTLKMTKLYQHNKIS